MHNSSLPYIQEYFPILIQSINWFNVQAFTREGDSDARKKTDQLPMNADAKSSVFRSCLELPSDVAQRVFTDELFQTTGAEFLKAREALAMDGFGFSRRC